MTDADDGGAGRAGAANMAASWPYTILGEELAADSRAGDEDRYSLALAALKDVFTALALGITPDLKALTDSDIAQFKRELFKIILLMDKSARADVVSCAIELMGVFRDPSFARPLQAHLHSPNEWDRAGAVKAVAGYPEDWARTALDDIAVNDSDEHVRLLARANRR